MTKQQAVQMIYDNFIKYSEGKSETLLLEETELIIDNIILSEQVKFTEQLVLQQRRENQRLGLI